MLTRALPIAVAATLGFAAPAAAKTITLGALDPTPHNPDAHCEYIDAFWIDDLVYPDGQDADGFSTFVPSGGGVITSWSTSQQPKGMKVRLAVVRATNKPRDGVIVRRRSRLHRIHDAGAVVTYRSHLRIHKWEQIALETPPSKQPDGDCAYPVKFADFLHVAGDDVRTGQFTDYVTGDGYDHQRANLRVRLKLAKKRHTG